METKSIFRCPVCCGELHHSEKTLRCGAGHSYDISRGGYVNLLLPNQKGSREPGDSREMLLSRGRFLDSGLYRVLADEIASTAADHLESINGSSVILDAGCGEGYYTRYMHRNLTAKYDVVLCGIDISKEGIILAAKRSRDIRWGVAGVHSIPLHDDSADIILSIFAPHDSGEFRRTLKPGGIIISVTPGPEHLDGLKELLYDKITLHDEMPPQIEGLSIKSVKPVKYSFTITDREIKNDLLIMTPYYWNAKKDKKNLFIAASDFLTATADFRITVYTIS